MATTSSPDRLATSSVALPTPFWFSGAGGSSPATCRASIINPGQSSTTYCCNGLLIDIKQPILSSSSSQQQPFNFEDLRCCSGDPNVALGSITSCSTGTATMLATSVAQVTSNLSSMTTQTDLGRTSTSTKTETRQTQFTTTATAATPSSSESNGRIRSAGSAIYLLTFLSLLLSLAF